MSADPLNTAAAEVLRQYPRPLYTGVPLPLGNRGGFSGARLWRLDGPAGPLCLRAWPAGFSPQRLDFIHHCMNHARTAGLAFVLRLFVTAARTTAIEYAGRLWELQEWLPGEADYHRDPSPEKLRRRSSPWPGCTFAGKPPSRRRAASVRPSPDGWKSSGNGVNWCNPAGGRRREPTTRRGRRRKTPGGCCRNGSTPYPSCWRWADRTWPLRPCLCDVWHDHVLFDGDRVTGMIDYGAMKIDHPAVDVARLLGSLVEDDLEGWAMALTVYREVRPLSDDEAELARALDVTGTIAAAAVWLRWLYYDGKEFEDRAAAGRRLESIAVRLRSHR